MPQYLYCRATFAPFFGVAAPFDKKSQKLYAIFTRNEQALRRKKGRHHKNEMNEQNFATVYPPDKNFVFVDVETANWSNDRICAIGMIIVSNGKTAGYYSLIYPHAPITFTYIHGITNEDVKDAPTMEEFWQVMSPLIPNDFVFVAHNYRFDLTVMKKDLGRFGISFCPTEILDTMWVARDILYHFRTQRGDLRLDTLSAALDVSLYHHNAASDITATKEVLEKLLALGNRKITDFIRPYQPK